MIRLARIAAILAAVALMLAVPLLALQWLHGGFGIYSVQSDSMRPVIAKGDAVVVIRPAARPSAGQVVTYRDPAKAGLMVSHRLVANNDTTIITKGDANVTSDQPVPYESVVGTVRARIPHLGSFVDALRQPAGLICMVYIPACLLAWMEIRHLARTISPPTYVLYR